MNENDEIYLKIWEVEQADIRLRWTIVTFFISVSFAMWAFSFRGDNQLIPIFIQQIVALAVYWFAFLVHLVLYNYSLFLRGYLREMENSNKTSLELRTKADTFLAKGDTFTVTQLLLFFGIGYTVITMSYFLCS